MARCCQYRGRMGCGGSDREDDACRRAQAREFSFAMITGVKHGWLDRRVWAGGADEWIAVVGYVAQNNDVPQVSRGGEEGDSIILCSEAEGWGIFQGSSGDVG